MSGRIGLSITKIANQLNAVKETLSPIKCRIHIPGGFPYEAYNGSGCIKPWSILRMVDASQVMVYNPDEQGKSFLDADKIFQDYFVFVAASRSQVSSEMYNPDVKKGPLNIDVQTVQIGNSSYNLQTSLILEGHSKPLAVNNVQCVFVSNKTRKPTAPPDWWTDKYTKATETQGEALKISPPDVSSMSKLASDYTRIVPISDSGMTNHTNWSNLVKYCYDAYSSHVLKPNTFGLETNINRNAKSFTASFIRESGIGDTLNVHVWQSKENRDNFYFQILRDAKITNMINIEFYPDELSEAKH